MTKKKKQKKKTLFQFGDPAPCKGKNVFLLKTPYLKNTTFFQILVILWPKLVPRTTKLSFWGPNSQNEKKFIFFHSFLLFSKTQKKRSFPKVGNFEQKEFSKIDFLEKNRKTVKIEKKYLKR